MKKIYNGSCHCGAVRYQADIDFSQGTLKCNCSICTKTRAWLIAVQPNAFRLMAGSADLIEYQFKARKIHHLFCKHCGVRSFGWAEDAQSDKFYAVYVNCLDDVETDELVTAPVTYVDGRHDSWHLSPTEIQHL